jgi:hypothetical protein
MAPATEPKARKVTGAYGCGRYPVTYEEYAEITKIRDEELKEWEPPTPMLEPHSGKPKWWPPIEEAYRRYMYRHGRQEEIPDLPELEPMPPIHRTIR